MSKKMMLNTQVGACISFTVIEGNQARHLPLVNLAPILLYLWSFQNDLIEWGQALESLTNSFGAVIEVYRLQGAIIFSALRFGVGI